MSNPQRPKLAISFSGGRTSAVMTKLLVDRGVLDTHETHIHFANTGCEHPATLDFVHECEIRFGWEVRWLEAVVSPEKGVGVRHREVSYETASRNGEPFRDAVAKYGIFNRTSPACTGRLKTDVMQSFLREQGFTFGKNVDHDTAIGIRYDEAERMSANRKRLRLIYPLIDMRISKRDVALEIKRWGFDLQIPSDLYGNCVWCWKKTLRKHLTLAKECPSAFDFPKRMENEFGHVNGDSKAAKDGRRYWFKDHMTADQILDLSQTKPFTPYSDDPYDHAHDIPFDEDLDYTGDGTCEGSCDVYAGE